MNFKHCTRLLLAFLFACTLPLLALDAKDDEDDGLLKVERPDKCPKIADAKLEAAQHNKSIKEVLASHAEIMGVYRELDACKTMAEGGDKKIDLPVKIRAITVGMNRTKLDLLDFKESAPSILIGCAGC